jgi:hypothetical protein
MEHYFYIQSASFSPLHCRSDLFRFDSTVIATMICVSFACLRATEACIRKAEACIRAAEACLRATEACLRKAEACLRKADVELNRFEFKNQFNPSLHFSFF